MHVAQEHIPKYAPVGIGRWTTSNMVLDFRHRFDTWTMKKLVSFILLNEHYMSSAFNYSLSIMDLMLHYIPHISEQISSIS